VKPVAEAGREIVKDVRVASHACQEQEYITVSTPIEIVQIDSIHVYKIALMRGLVHLFSSLKIIGYLGK
jgi:hypothetical protein